MGILRGGRILIASDGGGSATVLAPGVEPTAAYATCYGVVRHPLAGLLPPDGSKLRVSIYAYQNDYASCQLKLNLDPFVVTTDRFPPPNDKLQLNVPAIEQLFSHDVEIVGGKLDSQRGLILFGSESKRHLGNNIEATLSDLAVAYRAVFHAGDNAAFVSLDPNRDPTLATVNLGGFLEDTHIGLIVLEADKRFKTITSGLDPNSHQDDRSRVRQFVPEFSTGAERDLGEGNFDAPAGRWISTRFWFYPDSVEVDADFDYRYALIRRAQFKADAERGRDDFTSIEDFDRGKQKELTPSIRENIDHLNANFDQYAQAFKPLHDLEVVARLMGICSWLKKAPAGMVDLDALLAIDLPACSTPRSTTQLIAVTQLSSDKLAAPTAIDARLRSKITYLTPDLDRSVGDFFVSAQQLARFYALAAGRKQDDFQPFLNAADQNLAANRAAKVRTLLKTKADVEAFAEFAADQREIALPDVIAALDAKIDAAKKIYDGLEVRLQMIKAAMARSDEDYNARVDEHNRLVQEIKVSRDRVNQLVGQYNAQPNAVQSLTIYEVGGGIDLSPEHFNIRAGADTPQMQRLKQIADAPRDGDATLGGHRLYSSASEPVEAPRVRRIPLRPLTVKLDISAPGSGRTSATSIDGTSYWSLREATNGWRDQLIDSTGVSQQRSFNSTERTIYVARYRRGQLIENIEGRFDGEDRIRFTRSVRKDLLPPQNPPTWWGPN